MIKIPEWEMEFRADRSSGPGGQSVNKTATKVMVCFDVNASKSLSEEQKKLAKKNLAGHLNNDGEVVLSEQNSRSQWVNRKTIIARLNELVGDAIIPEKERRKTKIPKQEKEKRIKEKKIRSEVKKLRSGDIDW